MKQQHHPIDLKTYQKGINSDSNKEILGSSDTGEHIDALNMRSMPMDGDNFAKKKIKGEQSVYPNIDNRCIGGTGLPLSNDYECMMSQEINENIIEIWASSNPSEAPIFRVNGKIVASSFDIPIDVEHPLQYAKNESCVSGEFYVTNFNTPPMVFSLKDLMENSGMLPGSVCTQKYFSEFNLDEYTIQSTGTLFKPMFIKQTTGAPAGVFDFVFGAQGLAVGNYSYSYRYVTNAGDRTPFAPITELIPVVRNASTQFDPYFPSSRTYGSAPNTLSPTGYGNHIRIKYDNTSNFSFIEVRRDSWYAGEPIDVAPVSEIIGSFPISAGLNIVNILDRSEPSSTSTEVLSEDELAPSFTVKKAKAIRYYNDRLYLMNISYESQDIEDQVDFVDENNPVFPTIQKINKEGHKNVFNAAMYKNNIRGERIGVGVVFFDNKGSNSYAVKVPNAESFTFPNRRDEISSEALGSSYFGVVTAANVDGNITQTYEVFDHERATRKVDFDVPGEELIDLLDNSTYNTLEPVSQSDTRSDFEYKINAFVGTSELPNANYNPRGFGLDYYSMGLAFKGVVSAPANYNDGFSIVQTPPARRVLAQGLGFYAMREADNIFGPDGGKETDTFWTYFPDLELYDPDTYQDLISNPASYQVQLVSPLGYFSELYSGFNDDLTNITQGVDMIMYARVLKDGLYSDGEALFNPLISGNGYSGIEHTDGFDYVAYGRYMNYITQDSPSFPSNSNGNNVFQVSSVEEQVTYSGRQTYLKLELDQQFYNEAGPQYGTGNADLDADDEGPMQFKEPLYVINLIKNDNQPSQGLVTEYRYSANYIKFKSKVLESNGSTNQSCTLVSERWEDCIPNVSGQVNNAYSGLYRFVYVVDAQGNERRWLNITFETPAFISALINTMAINGFDTVTDASGSYDVYGVYNSQQTTDGNCPIFTLSFNEISGFTNQSTIPAGSFVYVKYDNRIPVRVFNGDSYINESVWAAQDNEYGKNGNPIDDIAKFKWNVPLPFKTYAPSLAYRVWKNADIANTHNYVQDLLQFNKGLGVLPMQIRQLILLWTAETRINLSFAFNNESPDKANSDQHFPLVNYIPRPHKWNPGDEEDRGAFESNNSINIRYFDDYGFEWNLWKWGGFRFLPQTNLDYVKFQNTTGYLSVPELGFEEQSEYCTRVVWSERRPINIQNSPTVRTFPSSNFYDISDDTGEIKFAWSALSSDKGNNLYAFTNSGICLLLVDKRIIHEINANELATVGSDLGGILNQLWIDRRIGMSDETWRTWAEYSNALYFVNRQSTYMFSENQVVDVAVTGFVELLRRKFLTKLGVGYSSKMSGGFNVLTNEYIMNVEDETGFCTLIYGVSQQSLQCQSSYNYDKYLYVGNKLYGHKDFVTYELGIGNLIDGQEIECYVANVSDKEIYFDKEFIRIRVNSNFKPDKIFFYDSFDDYKIDNFSSVVDATTNPIAIKDYFGYECYIPRKLAIPNNRQQGRLVIFKIVSTDQEDFLVTSTGVQYKTLK